MGNKMEYFLDLTRALLMQMKESNHKFDKYGAELNKQFDENKLVMKV